MRSSRVIALWRLGRFVLWAGLFAAIFNVVHRIDAMAPDFARLAAQRGIICFDDCPDKLPAASYLTALYDGVKAQNTGTLRDIQIIIVFAAILFGTETFLLFYQWLKRKPEIS